MYRGNLQAVLLSLTTLLAGCIADSDMRDDVVGEDSVLESAGHSVVPWAEGALARELKLQAGEHAVLESGPTKDFVPYAFVGDLGSQIYHPVATASTAGLSSSYQPSCAYSNNAPDAVYTWTAPSSGNYVFTTATSYFDTILQIRPYTNPSASLGCNDDWGNTLDSAVTVALVAGQRVYVIVDGYGTASGTYRLNIARAYPSGWTPWRNRDLPGGLGDYETLPDFANAGQACANPTAVECQTVTGVPWPSTGEVYTCNTSFGGYCRNADQPDGYCLDYNVRFLCP